MSAQALTKAAILHALAAAEEAGRPISVVTTRPNGNIRVDFFLPAPAGVASANPLPR